MFFKAFLLLSMVSIPTGLPFFITKPNSFKSSEIKTVISEKKDILVEEIKKEEKSLTNNSKNVSQNVSTLKLQINEKSDLSELQLCSLKKFEQLDKEKELSINKFLENCSLKMENLPKPLSFWLTMLNKFSGVN